MTGQQRSRMRTSSLVTGQQYIKVEASRQPKSALSTEIDVEILSIDHRRKNTKIASKYEKPSLRVEGSTLSKGNSLLNGARGVSRSMYLSELRPVLKRSFSSTRWVSRDQPSPG